MGETEFRKYFEEKMKTESDGLGSFAFLDTRPLAFGKNSASFYFFTGVKFSEPCIWDIRANGGPLSFRTVSLKSAQQSARTNKQEALEISRRGQGYHLAGDVVFELKGGAWSVVEMRIPIYPRKSDLYDFAMVRCDANFQEIFFEVRGWALAHDKSFAFSLSTNNGGTKEFCAVGSDGSDLHAEVHFRAMTGPKFNPYFLVCPADSRPKAASVLSLQPTNVSYRLRTGLSVTFDGGKEVLFWCPIHHRGTCCDGTRTAVRATN